MNQNNHGAPVAEIYREWQEVSLWLDTAKAREMELRKQLCATFFPEPVEGTNNAFAEIDGKKYAVKVGHKLNRKLDPAALDAVMPELGKLDPALCELGVLIKYEAELVKKGYNALTDEQRKIFEQALTITEGAPELTITEVGAEEAPPATPIMDAYEAAKEKHKAKQAAKRPAPGAPHPKSAAKKPVPAVKKAVAPAAKKKLAPAKKPVAKPAPRKAVSKPAPKKRR